MSYCTADDVIERVSRAGLIYAADDDGDEDVSGGEQSAVLDRAIASAGAEIDAALAPHAILSPGVANEWLRHRAVDLAAERVAGRKGQAVPASLAEAARRSRDWLDEVRRGDLRVPGLSYAAPAVNASAPVGHPRLVNPRSAMND